MRLLATASRLRPIQVADRSVRPLRRLWAGRAAEGAAALVPGPPSLPIPVAEESWHDGALRTLGVGHAVGPDGGWSPAGASRLWAYRLHSFRWIHEVRRDRAADLVAHWIAQHPVGSRPGWEPYCLALRIREWLEWAAAAEPPGWDGIGASLVQQVESLRRQLEFHLLGNHLLENAVTLCWAALRLETGARGEWLRQGATLLGRCLREQVLGDGTHAERSPMYQAMVAEGLLRLGEVARRSSLPGARRVRALAQPAGRLLAGSLEAFVHPDGDYALVNDTALGMAPTVTELRLRHDLPAAGDACRGGQAREGAGFLAWRGGDADYLLFDVGPIGPAHQPGHGHAGALSFEWSLHGRRLITDTGVRTYEPGDVRRYDRSTAAHSTVEIDGRDQSDVWGAFRCGRRVRPYPPRAVVEGGTAVLRGGYATLGARGAAIRHAREVRVRKDALQVRDRVLGAGRHVAASRLHLAPSVEVRSRGEDLLLVRQGAPVAVMPGGFAWEVEASPYHPRFGAEQERACLVRRFEFRDRLEHAWCLRAPGGRGVA